MLSAHAHIKPGTLLTRTGLPRARAWSVLWACLLLTLPAQTWARQWIALDEDSTSAPTPPAAASLMVNDPIRGGAHPTGLSWSGGPAINLAVSTALGDQSNPAACSDGAGGMIVVWNDTRNAGVSGMDVYAQHVLRCGVIDPAWPLSGRQTSTHPHPSPRRKCGKQFPAGG